MKATQFPQTFTTSTMEVTLPVGTHVLELVVTDSAGKQSEPATVIIVVEPDTANIAGIRPNTIAQGSIETLEIFGENLGGVEKVEIGDPDVTVKKIEQVSEESILIEVEATNEALSGQYLVEVTAPGGTVYARLTVLEPSQPRIVRISPTWGHTDSFRAIGIYGSNLDHVTNVEFFVNQTKDEGIDLVEINPDNQPDLEIIDIHIRADAELGERSFVVTTDRGKAESPPGVTYNVREKTTALVERLAIHKPGTPQPGDEGRTIAELDILPHSYKRKLGELSVVSLASMTPEALKQELDCTIVEAEEFIRWAQAELSSP